MTTGGDLGVEWRPASGGFEVGLDAFHHRYRDLVDFDFQRFLHVNRARVTAEGIEGRLLWRLARGWAVAGDVTWQQVTDAGTGQPQRHQPRWSGGLRVDWQRSPRLSLHADLRRLGEQRDEQLPVPQLTRVPGYTVVGLGGAWKVRPGWRLDLRVDNLLDADYQTLIG